jgi:hypothetical protein
MLGALAHPLPAARRSILNIGRQFGKPVRTANTYYRIQCKQVSVCFAIDRLLLKLPK